MVSHHNYWLVLFDLSTGVSSIRAYGQQDRFIMESEQKVDAYLMAYYPKICAHRCVHLNKHHGL